MIRVAEPEDAARLAAVQLGAWQRSYADYVDPERFGTLADRVVRWRRRLAPGGDGRRRTLVFDQDRRVAGFASVGPADDSDLPGGDDTASVTGELARLYVDPVAQGAGVGGALLDAAEAWLRAEGYATAILWVFAENGLARDVYERRGWQLRGGAPREDLWAPEVGYRLAL